MKDNTAEQLQINPEDLAKLIELQQTLLTANPDQTQALHQLAVLEDQCRNLELSVKDVTEKIDDQIQKTSETEELLCERTRFREEIEDFREEILLLEKERAFLTSQVIQFKRSSESFSEAKFTNQRLVSLEAVLKDEIKFLEFHVQETENRLESLRNGFPQVPIFEDPNLRKIATTDFKIRKLLTKVSESELFSFSSNQNLTNLDQRENELEKQNRELEEKIKQLKLRKDISIPADKLHLYKDYQDQLVKQLQEFEVRRNLLDSKMSEREKSEAQLIEGLEAANQRLIAQIEREKKKLISS